ncbi:MAG: hypothetical protein Marn2KO_22910 [Marinobacter nauticus]
MGMRMKMAAVFSILTLILAAKLFDRDPVATNAVVAVTSEVSYSPVKRAVSAQSYIESGGKVLIGLHCLQGYGDSVESLGSYARKPQIQELKTQAEMDNSELKRCARVVRALE